jgi:hypothetical protein
MRRGPREADLPGCWTSPGACWRSRAAGRRPRLAFARGMTRRTLARMANLAGKIAGCQMFNQGPVVGRQLEVKLRFDFFSAAGPSPNFDPRDTLPGFETFSVAKERRQALCEILATGDSAACSLGRVIAGCRKAGVAARPRVRSVRGSFGSLGVLFSRRRSTPATATG